jgi:hypothetical protein
MAGRPHRRPLVIILGIWLIFYAAVLMVQAFSLRPGRQRATVHQATT